MPLIFLVFLVSVETAEDSKQKVEEVLDKAREVKEHAKEAVSETLIKAKDSLRYRTNEVSNKAKDVIGAAYKNSYDFSQTTATKVSTAVMEKVIPTVNQYVPDEQGRAKIGKFATSFVRNAAVYGLPMFLRYWVPGLIYLLSSPHICLCMYPNRAPGLQNEDFK